MRQLLVYLIQHIVDEPDKVEVREEEVDSQVTFSVLCAQEDIGKVIGKKGKIIKALRRVLGILAIKEGKRINISMVENQ